MGKNGNAPEKRKAYADALDVLTDEHLRKALLERQEVLKSRLATLVVDEMMPGGGLAEGHTTAKRVLLDALELVDNKLEGASRLLRSFNGEADG
jgi:hypothetical protein